VTSQPHNPSARADRTYDDIIDANASCRLYTYIGTVARSTSTRTSTPEPGGAGSTRRPSVATNGLPGAKITSAAVPVPHGRSTQIAVVSRNVTVTPYPAASVAATTSFCTSPYSDSEISCRTSSCRTPISGSCSASWFSAWRSAARSPSWSGTTTAARVGGEK
jgi:uncharacterized Zn-binding protein involved in type VI secretion